MLYPASWLTKAVFLWMPHRIFGLKMSCLSFKNKLTVSGLYKTVSKVLASDGWYHTGTEYLHM